MASEVLTPLQKALLRAAFGDGWFREHFYLTGGTALAGFHLHHRLSDDLDLFTHDAELPPAIEVLKRASASAGAGLETLHASPGFCRFSADGLKIDLVKDDAPRLGSPILQDDCMVDSLQNIAVNKTTAILGRREAKDYVDLLFILKDTQLDILRLLELAKQKDAGMDPFVWANIISDAQRLTDLPKMLRPLTLEELKAFFLDLRDRVLDRLNPER